VLSDHPGLWFPEVPVGTVVIRGMRLGRLEDAFGDDVQDVLAPEAGIVSYGLRSLATAEGDLLVSISRPVSGS
jgi:predicted deacylase